MLYLVFWRDEAEVAVFTDKAEAEACAELLNNESYSHPGDWYDVAEVPLDPPRSQWLKLV